MAARLMPRNAGGFMRLWVVGVGAEPKLTSLEPTGNQASLQSPRPEIAVQGSVRTQHWTAVEFGRVLETYGQWPR
jgi:hypothetical protein